MRNLTLIIGAFILLCTADVYATHIVGGELNYKKLTGNDYEIRLTVYRDCFNGQAPFDPFASLGVFDMSNNFVTSIDMPFLGLDTVPPTKSNACLIPPTNICYEVTTYIDTITLAPSATGYQLAYQRCCRNNSILNVDNPGATGATYYATIPGTSVVASNSNPVFKYWPPTFICASTPFSFDHSATDPDGDSLVYELFTPLTGASSTVPMPQPPNAPPYVDLTWLAPYSLNDVLGGTPMKINPKTGKLLATPGTIGQFVYGICVKEYRNGVYIGQTLRDFQVNVVSCPGIVVSSILSPTVVCGSLTAQFTNNSVGTNKYLWDFGNTGTTIDTSTKAEPYYTYPDTGLYSVMLIGYSPVDTNCNDTAIGQVYIYPLLESDFTYTAAACSTVVDFNSTSTLKSGNPNTWTWDFGNNTTGSTEDTSYTYSSFGTYTVKLIVVTDQGCSDTVSKSILLAGIPVADFSSSIDSCTSLVHFSNLSTNGVTYKWDFGDGQSSALQNPVHRYDSAGLYRVSLVVNESSPCVDSVNYPLGYSEESIGGLYLANTITPNGDGLNDKFFVSGGYSICDEYTLYVFNRWGHLLFESHNQSDGWDGSDHGKKLPDGVYVYMLKNNDKIVRSGTISVIR